MRTSISRLHCSTDPAHSGSLLSALRSHCCWRLVPAPCVSRVRPVLQSDRSCARPIRTRCLLSRSEKRCGRPHRPMLMLKCRARPLWLIVAYPVVGVDSPMRSSLSPFDSHWPRDRMYSWHTPRQRMMMDGYRNSARRTLSQTRHAVANRTLSATWCLPVLRTPRTLPGIWPSLLRRSDSRLGDIASIAGR